MTMTNRTDKCSLLGCCIVTSSSKISNFIWDMCSTESDNLTGTALKIASLCIAKTNPFVLQTHSQMTVST